MCLKKVAYRSPPPAPVRAPLAERPGSAVRRCNRSRAAGAEPHPPNWPTQRRPLLLVGSGVAMPVPRPAPPVSRCRLHSVCCLRPPQPVSAPLALVPRDLVRTQGGRPATGATGLHTPPPKKEKHRKRLWKPVAGVAALPVCWLRPPPLLVVPALRVLVLPLLPAFALVAPGSLGREFGEMALTFTMECLRPFGESWPTYSMQHWSPKY